MGKEKTPWYMDPNNPNSGIGIGLSICCASKMNTVGPSLGDATLYICGKCGNFTMPIFVPIWETVCKGTHRKIIYNKQKLIHTMNWIKLEKGIYPEFETKVVVAQFFEEEDTEPIIGVGRLVRIDIDGFIFEGDDSIVFNNGYRKNKSMDKFVPTHYCLLKKPQL